MIKVLIEGPAEFLLGAGDLLECLVVIGPLVVLLLDLEQTYLVPLLDQFVQLLELIVVRPDFQTRLHQMLLQHFAGLDGFAALDALVVRDMGIGIFLR